MTSISSPEAHFSPFSFPFSTSMTYDERRNVSDLITEDMLAGDVKRDNQSIWTEDSSLHAPPVMVNPSPPRFPVQISGDLPPGAKKGEPGHPAKAHVNQSPKSVGYYPIDLSQTPIESSHSHSSTYTLASSYNGTVHLARRLPPRGVKEARPQLFRLQIPGGTQGENVLTDAIACEEILPFSPGGAERFRGRSDRGKHGLGSTSIHGDSLQIQTDSITEGSDRPDLVHESGDLSPETPTLVTPRPLYDQHQQLGPHSFSICVAEHGISGNLGGMGEGAGFGQDRALEELIRRTGNVAKRARRGAV